ncbi:histidine phosphatase family protein [Demequina sp. NBRC 110055]|uniref:histidine phosphatase family protein n=1 Tax=Demequina sp. NBRC 110055 TaxID=1570344 RepID=UPI0013562C0F|nr:histidine phosphatase family protein [Demequina sp. NBRC 110055]
MTSPSAASGDTHETGSDVAPEPARGASLYDLGQEGFVSPLTLVLVRHGVTDMTVTHALSGSGEVGPSLNSAGRVQAAKAADAVYRIGRKDWDRVPHVSRVFASPMTRTQETGGAIGRRVGAHVETEERVREVHFGDWEGLTGAEITRREPENMRLWGLGDHRAPGGESLHDVGLRMNAFIEDAARQHASLCAEGSDDARAWAVASHAVAIKTAVAISLGMPVHGWARMWPQPASLTLLQLRVREDGTIAERHLLAFGVPTH